MEEQIRKMHLIDRSLIIGFIIFLWAILLSIMSVVSELASNDSVRITALAVGIIAGLSATSALVALLNHLKTHRNQLYSEDILWSQYLKKGK